MLILHHLNFSRSTRILWLLEELQLPYELKTYERNKNTLFAPPELKSLSPIGGAPILQDGGLTVFESAVIIEYILDTYGTDRLRPPLYTPERLAYNYWLHYSESTLAPLSSMMFVLKIAREKSPWIVRPIVAKMKEAIENSFLLPRRNAALNYLEEHLSKNDWLAGDQFTAADIQVSCGIILSGLHRLKDQERPFLKAYIKKIEEIPSFQRAIEKGGPLDFQLLKKT